MRVGAAPVALWGRSGLARGMGAEAKAGLAASTSRDRARLRVEDARRSVKSLTKSENCPSLLNRINRCGLPSPSQWIEAFQGLEWPSKRGERVTLAPATDQAPRGERGNVARGSP